MSAPMKRTVDLFYDVISAYSWFSFEVGSHTSSSAVMMIYLTVYGLCTEWHMLERQVQDIFMYQPLIRILHISDIQYVVFMYFFGEAV